MFSITLFFVLYIISYRLYINAITKRKITKIKKDIDCNTDVIPHIMDEDDVKYHYDKGNLFNIFLLLGIQDPSLDSFIMKGKNVEIFYYNKGETNNLLRVEYI